MSVAERLGPIADFAGQVEDDAARALAASAKTLSTKEAELAQLRAYLAEYRQTAAVASATDVARWQNARAFLARLGEAVALKERELLGAVEQHRLKVEHWRGAQQRATVLDKVVERAEREERRTQAHREQLELDEQAAQRGGLRG